MNNEMIIKITDYIDYEHQAHYWYDGECANIKYYGYKAVISACGDVWANLYNNNKWADHICDKKWENAHLIETVRKGDSFYERFSSIKDDNHLQKLEETGFLRFEERNWWECTITDPQGNTHDLEWVLDSTYLLETVDEVQNSLISVIESLETENEKK